MSIAGSDEPKLRGKVVLTDERLRDIMANENLPEDMRGMADELLARRLSVKPLTGEEVVFKMRDEFLQLSKCYLDIHDYKGALDAVHMVQRLEKFEDQHCITNITWPAKAVVNDKDHEYYLEGNEDSRSYP